VDNKTIGFRSKSEFRLTSIITNDLIDIGFLIREKSIKLKLRKEEELMKRWGAAYNSGMQKSKAYYSSGTLYEIGQRISEIAKDGPTAAEYLIQLPSERAAYAARVFTSVDSILRKIR
jgi:hypothetical protein